MPRNLEDEIRALRRSVQRWKEDMEDQAADLTRRMEELADRVKESEKPPKGSDDDE